MTAKPSRAADLQADLLADLEPQELLAPEPVVPPAPEPPQQPDTTPALSVQWTPLRWSRPRVVRAARGAGKAVQLGPVKVELSVRDR